MAVGGEVLRARSGSQRLVLAAAFITIIVATTALTALVVYLQAASTSAIQESLAARPSAATGVTITTTSGDSPALAAADSAVRSDVADVFRGLPHDIALRLGTGTTYTLPTKTADGGDTITTFVWRESLLEHATLTDGVWPSPARSGEPVEIALSDGAAGVLGVSQGAEFDVVQRLSEAPVHVRVTGVFRPDETDDWYWRSDDLDTLGTHAGATYPVIGPLFVANRATLQSSVSSDGFDDSWRVGVDWSSASLPTMDATRDRIEQFATDAGGSSGRYGPNVRIESGLTTLLPSLSRSLTASQSMMVIPILQLALLAALTLFLAARLLADHRREESALLQARGASRAQAVGLALRETAMLVLPAALFSPLLAYVILLVISGHGPFETLAGRVPAPTVGWWVISFLAALLCALSLVLPSIRRSRSYVEAQAERGRESRRGMIQRAGVDVLLLGGAVVAYWQLRHYATPVISGQTGTRIDPLLVLAPCLALFAAAALSLRLLPQVARLAQHLASRGSQLAAALGTWQVSRRPLRYSGPALLLVLALAIGALSAAHASSWLRSQDDQATFAAGADVRATGASAFGSVPPAGQGGAIAAAPDVTEVMAVNQGSATVADQRVVVLGLDSRHLATVVRARPDLVPEGLDALAAKLLESRPPAVPAVIKGPTPSFTLSGVGTRTLGTFADPDHTATLSIVFLDGSGSTFASPPMSLVFDGQPHDLTVDFAAVAGSSIGQQAAVTFPLQVIGLTAEFPVLVNTATLPGGGVATGPGTARLVLTDPRADATPVELAATPAWTATTVGANSGTSPPKVVAGAEPSAFADVAVSANPDGTGRRIRLSGVQDVATIPIVLDRAAADATGAATGDTATVRADGVDVAGKVTAVVPAFPGTDPSAGVVLADLPTLAAHRWASTGAVTPSTDWWLASSDPGATMRSLDAQPRLVAAAVSASALARSMRSDPLGQATLGAMFAGFVVALLFAGVGFVTNLVIGARERLAEFAVLRALGVSRVQVMSLLLVEQTFLVGLGVVVGFGVGIFVSFLVIPYVVLSAQALRTLPPVIVDVPWLQIGLFAAGTVVVLALAVAVSANRLQRQGLGRALRIGEDR